jgi:hypothetical protein
MIVWKALVWSCCLFVGVYYVVALRACDLYDILNQSVCLSVSLSFWVLLCAGLLACRVLLFVIKQCVAVLCEFTDLRTRVFAHGICFLSLSPLMSFFACLFAMLYLATQKRLSTQHVRITERALVIVNRSKYDSFLQFKLVCQF